MTKRGVIKAAHVRNKHFIGDLKTVIELVPLHCLGQATRIHAASDEATADDELKRTLLQTEVLLAKTVLERLEALLETWPNAVWLFFPDTGPSGWIRLLNEFHSKIVPLHFPGAPPRVMWRSKRVRGNRWCGLAPRIRRESQRTFQIWDQFMSGRKPIEIARREFPSRHGQQSKKALMAVHRSLERASQLIYGQSLPKNRKIRRLQGFDQGEHMATCVQCQSATKVAQLCPVARDFSNQDERSFLHNWTSL